MHVYIYMYKKKTFCTPHDRHDHELNNNTLWLHTHCHRSIHAFESVIYLCSVILSMLTNYDDMLLLLVVLALSMRVFVVCM